MSDVVDLDARRRQRDSRRFFEQIREGQWSETELDVLWDEAARPLPQTDLTSAYAALTDAILHPPDPSPFRREWLNSLARRPVTERSLRIVRDRGNAEGHRADPGLPRR